ncbi:MAG TPA: prenyltransferase/squalene oxidase repeat-containing protein [Thermoleophilaceae bacterium]|nr:prenyltransferase/squalene oxidase repeat-containing protein [Thermoleophilaceae bacterium]
MSWALSSFALLAIAVAVGLAWYERERPSSRVLALVAALAALGVVGRLAFAAIPNVKPVTDIVLFAGFALGAAPGFAVGAITALVSNVFLSQGPWTVWQMAGWGAVGVAGALLARALRGREPGRVALALVCGLAGLAFGAWMDLYQWTLAARQDLDSYVAVSISSLPYNLAHAIGNVAFCLLIGPAFIRALGRYRRRFEVRWRAPAAATGVLLVLLVAVAAPAPALGASAAAKAERYLLSAQGRDGGFGGAKGDSSSALYSGWAALGLAAAGNNPRDVRRGGRTLAAYVRRAGRSEREIGEVERTVLVLDAAGLSPRSFGGRDLIGEIRARRRADGSIAGYVSYSAFGVLALRAAGESAGAATVRWLVGSQNADGGFGVARNTQSDTDMTGATLQALAVTGRARGRVARRAVAYLLARQNRDGGFPQMEGRDSNSQSTSYAVQGLTAARAAPGAVARGLGFLRRRQRPEGSVAYSASSTQTPVWVTAQALAALHRATLPVGTVARAPSPEPAADAPSAAPKDARGKTESAARAGSEKRAEGGEESPSGPVATNASPDPPPPSGVTLDRARAEPDDGVPWLVVGAVGLVTLLLVLPFRRRLLRRVRGPSPD